VGNNNNKVLDNFAGQSQASLTSILTARFRYHFIMHSTTHILLTGASGFLGQHLLDHFMKFPPSDSTYKITALYHKSENFAKAIAEWPSCPPNVQIVPMICDLVEFSISEKFDVCIHTAALSSPRVCQQDPEKAIALNVPLNFLKATKKVPIIVLSTDQVYDGKQNVDPNKSRRFYNEDTATRNPLNVYAQTKVQLEQALQEIRAETTPTAILRSSIILGPNAPISPDDAHDTFMHFCATRQNQETDLWVNEHRTVVSVGHVCRVIDSMVQQYTSSSPKESTGSYQIFNMGGPLRLNRYDMATAVFEHFGWESKGILKKAEQTAPTVPLDISMDSTKLQEWTDIVYQPDTLKELVEYVFPKGKQLPVGGVTSCTRT
jgi:dTDP-4-dehydrorhamnose reductase